MNPINLPKPLIQLQLDEVLKNNGKTIIQNTLQKKFYVTVRNNPHIIPDDVFGLALLLNKEADIFIENKNHYFGANFALCTWVKVFESIQNELCFTCISATKSSDEIWFGIKAGKLILRSGNRVIFSSTTDFPISQWTAINLVFQERGNNAAYKIFINNQELTAGLVPKNDLNTFKYISIAHGIDANNSNVPLGLGGFEFYEQPLSLDILRTVTQKGLIVKKTFNESYPLDFLLSTDDTLNTLYIKDKGTQNTFTFQLKNSLQENLEFKAKLTTNIPLDQGILSGVAPSFYHVKLTFRPKIFETSPASTAWKYLHCSNPPNNWIVTEFLETNGNVSLFFTYTGTTSLVFEAEKEIDFDITYNNIEKTLGSRLTQAMLGYENIVYQNEPTKGYVSGNRKHPINIVNHSGEKNIPILAGIVKSDTILNTSDTGDTNQEKKSRLYIRLKNIHKKNSIQFNDKTQLTVSFDTSDKHWALTTANASKAITIDLLNSSLTPYTWAVVRTEDQGLSRVFVIQQFKLNELQPNESLDFEIGNIFTDKVSGETPIYIKYKNIPTYQDGQFIVKAKKGPIVEGDFNDAKNIGIGVNADKDYQLKIGGNLKIEADAMGSIVNISNKDSSKTYFEMSNHGDITITKNLYLQKGGTSTGSTLYFGGAYVYIREYNNQNTNKLELYGSSGVEVANNINVKGKVKENGNDLIPSGTIVMWSGNRIPNGWKLCNGSNGTPDLRNRFIVGADPNIRSGNEYYLGKKGGQKKVTLGINEMPSHNHSIYDPGHAHVTYWHYPIAKKDSGAPSHYIGADGRCYTDYRVQSSKTNIRINHRGGNQAHENRPPYYALYYIMKI